MADSVVFHADGIKIYGAKADGGYTVTLSIGEYEQEKLAKLFLIPQNTVVKVTIEQESDA